VGKTRFRHPLRALPTEHKLTLAFGGARARPAGKPGGTLRIDLRGIAKAALLRRLFKGGAPFSRKSLLRSVGLTSRSAWKRDSPSNNLCVFSLNHFPFLVKVKMVFLWL